MRSTEYLIEQFLRTSPENRIRCISRLLREIAELAPDAVDEVAEGEGWESEKGPTHDDERGGRA